MELFHARIYKPTFFEWFFVANNLHLQQFEHQLFCFEQYEIFDITLAS
jgi:hypothetical protein